MESARSPHRRENNPVAEPENTENTDANPVRDPPEPRHMPSFTPLGSFFEAPYRHMQWHYRGFC